MVEKDPTRRERPKSAPYLRLFYGAPFIQLFMVLFIKFGFCASAGFQCSSISVQIAQKELFAKKYVFFDGSQNGSNILYSVSFEFPLRCRSKGFASWWICLFRLLSLPRGTQERIVFRRNDAFFWKLFRHRRFSDSNFFYSATCFI